MRSKRKITLKINWTPGVHNEEMMEACYLILKRYAKVQKNCCLCGGSRTMKRVNHLIRLYKKYRWEWDDLDLAKITLINAEVISVYKSASYRWMRMVLNTHESMWC